MTGTINERCVAIIEKHNTWCDMIELSSKAEAEAYRDELAAAVNAAHAALEQPPGPNEGMRPEKILQLADEEKMRTWRQRKGQL
jgi:hypothetical protein